MQYVGEKDLGFIGKLTGLSEQVLRGKIIEELFPRIETFRNQTTIFLWDSRIAGFRGPEDVEVEKRAFLIVCSGPNILTLSTGTSDLLEQVLRSGLPLEGEPFTARVLYALMRAVVSDSEKIVLKLERQTIRFEDAPVGASGRGFLDETFRLKREIQKTRYNLWHIKQVLDSISERRPEAFMGSETLSVELEQLNAEARYLYETLESVRDALMSLIELHLNTVSFEMNRLMRVLAVITCVAVIPAIVAGFLGENLTDQPYSVTLSEVPVLVAIAMLLTTYAFWRNGWLRG